MTMRRWITLVSAAALLAGVGACNDNKGGSPRPGATEPQGRRGDQPSRMRSDAGAETSAPGTGSSTGTSATSSPSSPSDSSGSSSSSSSSDTTKR